MAEIAASSGLDPAVGERAAELIRRGDLTDAETQTLEDGICLAFLETQFGETAGRLDTEKMVAILAKTLAKMSVEGRQQIPRVSIPAELMPLVTRATDRAS